MKRFKFVAIMLMIASFIITATPAHAADQGKIYKDQSGAVFIYGLQSGQTIETGRDFAPARFIISNACGLLIVKPSKTQPVGRIRIEGRTIDSATLPTQVLPSCKNGQLAEARTRSAVQASQPFKTGAGNVAIPLQPTRRYQVSMLDRRQLRNSKANACGFVRFPSDALGDKPLLPTIARSVARFAISDLPVAAPILCQRKQLYAPLNFPPPLAVAMSNQTIVDEGGSTPAPLPTPQSNTAPTISAIATQTMNANESITVNFTIGSETPEAVTLTSRNHSSIPASSVVFGGKGANRTVTITPPPNTWGVIPDIEIVASNGTDTTSAKFPLIVINNSSLPQYARFGYKGDGDGGGSSTIPFPPQLMTGICKTSNSIIAKLTPNTPYQLGFDDWSEQPRATATAEGIATFTVSEMPPDELDAAFEYQLRDAHIYDISRNLDRVRRAVLRDIPPCW